MINKETILSNYNDRLTLLQWLKKVELALQNASAKEFRVNKLGNATLTFSIVFDDDTELTTGPIVLEQGESVASATITGGHLLLTLTNGDVLDAGSVGAVSSFSIDGSQHLIVTYQDGTTQDLGSILNGNVNITGSLTADTIQQANANWTSPNIELNPSGDVASAGVVVGNIYNRFEVINNVLFVIVNVSFHNPDASPVTISGNVRADKGISAVPAEIGSKIIDFEGKSVAEVATTEHCLIAGAKALTSRGLNYNFVEDSDWNEFITNRTTANLCQLFVQKNTPLTISAGGRIYVSARFPLTLI